LLAHHAVIFDNVKQIIWVSAYPFQINTMNAYSLSNFDSWQASKVDFPIITDSLQIAADPFYNSDEFNQFTIFKKIKNELLNATKNSDTVSVKSITSFVNSNPEYYDTYRILGDYFMGHNNFEKAIQNYRIGLTKEIAYQEDKNYMKAQIDKINADD